MIFTGALISRLKNSIRILNLKRIDNHCTLIKLKLRAKAVPDILRRIKRHADFIAALEKNDFDPVLAECCPLSFDGRTTLGIPAGALPGPFLYFRHRRPRCSIGFADREYDDHGSQMNVFACDNSELTGKLLKVAARSGAGGGS